MVVVVGITSTATAQAQATAEQAREIATALKRYIDSRILEPSPELSLDLDGQIEVAAAGDRHVGSVPSGRLLVDTNDGSAVALTFAEPLTFELFVTDRGWYDVTFTVPSSVRIGVYPGLMPNEISPGEPPALTATGTIGQQRGSAVLMPEYETVASYDLAWSDLRLRVAEQPIDLQLGRLSAIQTGREVEPGIFDNRATFDLANLALSVIEEDLLIELDGLSGEVSATGVNLPAQTALLVTIEPLLQQLETQPEDPGLYEELRSILAETPNLIDGIEGTSQLHGLRIHTQDQFVGLAQTTGSIALSGLASDHADLSLSFDLSGLEIQPEIPFQGLIPIEAGYDIRATDISTDVLLDWLDTLLASIPELGAEVAVPASFFTLYEDLAGTGALLDIRSMHVETQSAGFSFSGRIRPDSAAMFGATVEADLEATALGRLTETLRTLPDAGAAAAAGLAMIQALGSRETNDSGETVHRYQFEVTRDGMVMLNGNDLGPILDQVR